jgi:hypothetical protein
MESTHYRGMEEKVRKKICPTNSDIKSYNNANNAPMTLTRKE